MSLTTKESFLKDAEEYHTIPVSQSFYTDTLTPIHMFHALRDEAVYMLESQDPESPWSNFSFIGLDPMIEVKQLNGTFVIDDFHENKSWYADSFKEAFEQTVHDLKVKQADVPLPFKGEL